MFLLDLLIIIGGVALIRYRERVGDTIGEASWMSHVGGVYNFIVIVGVLAFFVGVAMLTNTVDIFFAPLYWIFGGVT